MTKYLNPTNDVAFKKLFGTEEHKNLLINFLNTILHLKGNRKIKTVEFLPNDHRQASKNDKLSILDIKCTDKGNASYIVEMQNRKSASFLKRTQYYVAKSYTNQLGKGEGYEKLLPVILIAITMHKLFPGTNPISLHKIMNTETHVHHLKDLVFAFVELPKFEKDINELVSNEDEWLFFMKNWNVFEICPKAITIKEVQEAYEVMEICNWSKKEMNAYDMAEIARMDAKALKDEQKERMKKAVMRGERKGERIGERRGERMGERRGERMGERKAQVNIAKKLLKDKVNTKTIASYTGLTPKEISALTKKKT